jgi:hypothetical protein
MPSRKDRGNAQIFEKRNVEMASMSPVLAHVGGRTRRNFIARCSQSGWRSFARLGRTTLMSRGRDGDSPSLEDGVSQYASLTV